MKKQALEVLSDKPNYAIVRMPGREYPGCVIQGDSLSVLVALAKRIQTKLKLNGDEDLECDAQELLELLNQRIDHYEHTLSQHGFKVPYVKD